MKQCTICGKPLPNDYKKDICKECKKDKRQKWFQKNGKWIAVSAAAIAAYIAKVLLTSDTSEEQDTSDSTEDDYSPEVIKLEPGEKYWNPNTNNWEKDGKPYSYRVSYRDRRDGEIHTHNYADVDNGYEDYQYYNKQWWAADTQWDHVPPDEE